MNFESEDIKVNESALEEIIFLATPLMELNSISMFLCNIRSWNGRLEHFRSGKIYSAYFSLCCFTEISINDSPAKHIDKILGGWKDIHKNTQHGLALCCNVIKVKIIEVFEIPSVLEVLSIVLEIKKKTMLLIIVYYMLGPLGWFIDDFLTLVHELPTQHRMLIVGDFNLDQMLPELVAKIDPLIQNFNLS